MLDDLLKKGKSLLDDGLMKAGDYFRDAGMFGLAEWCYKKDDDGYGRLIHLPLPSQIPSFPVFKLL